jgi:8-oxo-dGTP pyrophosphatase MutT (NUDIX family)
VARVEQVQAAGGVVVRDALVALVHRPRYDDWTLPKGKLDPGESFEEAAVREVEEETGISARLVRELPATEYSVGGRPKLVRYWLMEAEAVKEFVPNDEVDEILWLPLPDAFAFLTYKRDQDVLRAADS